MGGIQLTVLLATRNGAHVLPRTLRGYRCVVTPTFGWKLVVVNNGSTDATPEILRSFQTHLPLQVLDQPVPGKNRSLNAAIQLAEGSLVVLTDDDAIPHPSFLTAWAKFLNSRTDYELFGGSIEPLFEVPPPKWLMKSRLHFAMMFAERLLPDGPVAPDEIYGPNLAVRSSVTNRGFRFDERLGPDTTNPDYPSGGETEFCERVARSGARCWFASEPRVQHIVRSAQLTAASWARRAYRLGCARAIETWDRTPEEKRQHPSRDDRFRDLYRRVCAQLAMLSPLPKQRFEKIVAYHIERGFRDQWARQKRNLHGAPTNGCKTMSGKPL
jgi:GT2 family glycosyltransferase